VEIKVLTIALPCGRWLSDSWTTDLVSEDMRYRFNRNGKGSWYRSEISIRRMISCLNCSILFCRVWILPSLHTVFNAVRNDCHFRGFSSPCSCPKASKSSAQMFYTAQLVAPAANRSSKHAALGRLLELRYQDHQSPSLNRW